MFEATRDGEVLAPKAAATGMQHPPPTAKKSAAVALLPKVEEDKTQDHAESFAECTSKASSILPTTKASQPGPKKDALVCLSELTERWEGVYIASIKEWMSIRTEGLQTKGEEPICLCASMPAEELSRARWPTGKVAIWVDIAAMLQAGIDVQRTESIFRTNGERGCIPTAFFAQAGWLGSTHVHLFQWNVDSTDIAARLSPEFAAALEAVTTPPPWKKNLPFKAMPRPKPEGILERLPDAPTGDCSSSNGGVGCGKPGDGDC